MATYRPIDSNGKPAVKPWHARRKRDGVEYHLGYFATEGEALAVERSFDTEYPPLPTGRRYGKNVTTNKVTPSYQTLHRWRKHLVT